MTNTQHTPGPWRIEYRHPTVRTLAYITADHRPTGHEICNVYGCDGNNEETANARLIAAAPELLEALEITQDFLYETLKSLLEQNRDDAALRCRIKRNASLIAKSRGQS